MSILLTETILSESTSQSLFYIFHQVDVDELEDVAGENGIQAMPTFIFFKGAVNSSIYSRKCVKE